MISMVIAVENKAACRRLEAMVRGRPDIRVEYCVRDGEMLIEYARKNRPDIVLMDMHLPKKNGVECTEAIRGLHPQIKILILTEYEDDAYIFDAIRLGANGFLPEAVEKEELIEAIGMVCGQGAPIHPMIAVRLFDYLSQIAGGEAVCRTGSGTARFNRTEMKIIRLVGTGLSNKEIAKKLCLSDGTCRNYVSEILNKTELRDRTQLAIFAIQKGWTIRCECG